MAKRATKKAGPCSAPDCDRAVYAKGLCEPHWRQAARAEVRGKPAELRPIRDLSAPPRVVLTLRVSPEAKERATKDPAGARAAIEKWAGR
jgi:hypothetical protein